MSCVKSQRNPLRFRAAIAAALGAGILPALAHAGLTLNLSTTAGLTAPPTAAQTKKFLTPDNLNANIPVYVYATVTGAVATDFQGVQYAYYNVNNAGTGGANQVSGSITSASLPGAFNSNGSLAGQLQNVSGGISLGSIASLDYANETAGSNGPSPAKPRSGNYAWGAAGTSATFLLETLSFTPTGASQSPVTFTASTNTTAVKSVFSPDVASLSTMLAANGLQGALWFQDSTSNAAATASPGGGPNAGAPTIGTTVTLENTIKGDANADGIVNGADIQILGAHLNASGQTWGSGDFTGDGIVNGADIQALGANLNLAAANPGSLVTALTAVADAGDFGSFAQAGLAANPGFASVPEPTSVVALIGLGGLSLLRRRRRAGGASFI